MDSHNLFILLPLPEGLKLSSFVDFTVVLLGIPGVTHLFSERFCQDPLEAFFFVNDGSKDRPLQDYYSEVLVVGTQ